MAKKKTLYLHIGSPKTGTTSLQMRLFHNQNALAKHNFCYPGKEFSHQKIFFKTNCAPDDWARQFRGQNHAAVKQIVNNYIFGLEKDLRKDFGYYLMSAEDLFIWNRYYVENILEYFSQFFDEIKVISVVRDPVDYYRSYQQELIKARSYIESPSHFKYDFKKVIETWSEFVEVKVLGFIPGQDIFKVFCNLFGLRSEQFKVKQGSNNSSMSIEQILLLEKVQKHLYQGKDDMLKVHLKTISNINAPSSSKVELQERIKPIVYTKHREDVEWLYNNHEIDFRNPKLKNTSPTSIATFESSKVEVKDVFKVNDPESAKRYEALIVDGLLRKLVS